MSNLTTILKLNSYEKHLEKQKVIRNPKTIGYIDYLLTLTFVLTIQNLFSETRHISNYTFRVALEVSDYLLEAGKFERFYRKCRFMTFKK
ncbi:MAG: hypothetical protein IJH63_08810 [Methanobrevibacter sp.]|uniref:hypothetical protein n=1 Tax=Methanobrevibacter millerae TaxID=230361 RepID=UPI0026F374CB|nr:hypothetical protein [Methanobrevibacter millerae]MBR0059257.1 hypothetical protein [Methanobrevibacter sp.]MBR0370801.1 hypothetical protein [Methanobrevibacter sp.]